MVHTSPCVEERAGERCCLPSCGQYRLPVVAFRRRRDALYRGGPPSAPAARGLCGPMEMLPLSGCGRSHRRRAAMPLCCSKRWSPGWILQSGSADGTRA